MDIDSSIISLRDSFFFDIKYNNENFQISVKKNQTMEFLYLKIILKLKLFEIEQLNHNFRLIYKGENLLKEYQDWIILNDLFYGENNIILILKKIDFEHDKKSENLINIIKESIKLSKKRLLKIENIIQEIKNKQIDHFIKKIDITFLEFIGKIEEEKKICLNDISDKSEIIINLKSKNREKIENIINEEKDKLPNSVLSIKKYFQDFKTTINDLNSFIDRNSFLIFFLY